MENELTREEVLAEMQAPGATMQHFDIHTGGRSAIAGDGETSQYFDIFGEPMKFPEAS